ncbi:tetrahydromethanopterin S-methyltransferase subunit F [Methanobrevibacter curvatus]|uniref:Tetrahydromethanopterin S-methyltransferase subunit F n=1 Tax=Methanobrevibacter curvatus TaxID=49547 RepID=A0A166CFC4_9EURY|nr:tetrahydromethanopterin S-methyltransferase subunit F [Methanobrevibacter curvatus]KZX14443.1 tetrahydromethanopterin S-methyltransferase, F subunit MtrF [Methanobrevibacter curvatus]
MVKFSNKPNIKGIRNTAEDTNYKAKLIGREGRLFAGLNATRITGIAYGLILAFVLVIIIPLLAKAFGV